MRIKTIPLAIILLITLTQCTPYDFSRRIVQQGNLLPQSKITRLKIGMSKEDCAILMGNSLQSPLFSNNRWDYVYALRTGASSPKVHHIELYFDHNQLSRIDDSARH